MSSEDKAKREEQKALEESQLSAFLEIIKKAVAYVKNDNKYWVSTIGRSQPMGSEPDEDRAQEYVPYFVYEVYNEFKHYSNTGLPEGFAEKYMQKLLKVYKQEWIIPSCVFIRMLDIENPLHLSLWLDIPHRSEADPVGSLSYYRNMQDVVRERETRTKPGRWFGAKELGTEAEGLLFNSHWTSTGTPLGKYFLLSETKGLSEESWKWSYANTDKETGSCMIKVPDAARVFAYDNRLDLFYVTEDNTPEGNIVARTILRKDTKKYIRLYHTTHNLFMQAKSLLTLLGYEEHRSLHGINLGKITPDNLLDDSKLYWLSYIDSNSDSYIIDEGTHWLCHDFEDEESDDIDYRRNKDYYEAQYSKGYFGTGACSCGKKHTELFIAHTFKNGKEGVISSCYYCKGDYLIKETDYSSQYYDKDYYVILRDYTVDEDNRDEDQYYQSIVVRKGEEKNFEVSEDKILIESEGYLCVHFKEYIEEDVFGVVGCTEHDNTEDLFSYLSKSAVDFLVKEFTESGVSLPKHPYYDRFQFKIWTHSKSWDSIYDLTTYDWNVGRRIEERQMGKLLNYLEEQGKLSEGSYSRWLKFTGKVGVVKNISTFRSYNNGNSGFILADNEVTRASTTYSAYTFVTAA